MEAGGAANAVHLSYRYPGRHRRGPRGPGPTAESLSAALGTALDPGTRARAKAVAGTIRTDGTTVAAKLLIDAGS